MCLVVGGMAAMPAIRGRLNELFGPQRVEIPRNSATLVAQGAAWIAYDAGRLQLAKPIELQLARGSFLPVIKAGTEMPSEREVKRQKTHLFCTDPTDGFAKFELCAPTHLLTSPQTSDPRSPLGMLTVNVHTDAKPFYERLELDVAIDDDLILTARAWSSMAKDDDTAVIHDLEFGLPLPRHDDETEPVDSDPVKSTEIEREKGGLAIRANIAECKDDALVPGELLYRYNREAFERHGVRAKATEEQIAEHLYYQPCAVCGRDVNDPACRCSTLPRSGKAAVKKAATKAAVKKTTVKKTTAKAPVKKAAAKKKPLPEMSKKRQEGLRRQRERDAKYRAALGVAKGGELPKQIGNTTSAGGGRDRGKVARQTRKNSAATGRRVNLIG
jgi:molecular chaperone DnaK